MASTVYVFHSSLDTKSIAELLRKSIDPEERSLFSMSGYAGSRSFVGKVESDTFRIKRRRNYRNDFASMLSGRFLPEVGGTRIEVQIGMRRWTKLFTRAWLSAAVLLGLWVFVASLRRAVSSVEPTDSSLWVGLAVPPVLILFGILLPKFGQLLASADKEIFIQMIEETLSAHMERPAAQVAE